MTSLLEKKEAKERVMALRVMADMTQKELGSYLKIPIKTIEKWESGERCPSEYILDGIESRINPIIKEHLTKKWMLFCDERNGTGIIPLPGYDLIDAIERNFKVIAKTALGMSAGYTLFHVTARYSSTILSGKGGVILTIKAKEQGNLNSDSDELQVRDAYIYAKPEDLT